MSNNCYPGVYDFYLDRIAACPLYGFKSGEELLHLITKCAYHDSMLTLSEFDSIIKQAERCHIEMMEDNFNADW